MPWAGATYTKASDEERSGVIKSEVSKFRKYESIAQSIADHATFIISTPKRREYYASVINAETPEDQAKALAGTYATDSKYGVKLINTINEYNLKQYDTMASPSESEEQTMPTFLFVAGHGEQPGGGFDTGAIGYIKLGEHRYMEQVFFPAVKRALPNDVNVVFYSEHDCYAYGDIAAQAGKYGSDTVVIECHYDAAGSSAQGGHVIVYKGYEPDKYDIALRDGLKNSIGIFSGYSHRGYAGISGRDDLANANRTVNAGTNWRLIELGFGTNSHDADYMLNKADDLAKALVTALFGKTSSEAKTGWIKDDTGWWYRRSDGSYPKSELATIDGKEYYFNEDGYMHVGWKGIGGNWYLFGEDGAKVTGWKKWQDAGDGKTKWYFMDETGKMKSNEFILDGGALYRVNYDGSLNTEAEYKTNEDGSIVRI